MDRLQRRGRQVGLWVMKRKAEGDPELPPLKKFRSKFNLPVLNDYRSTPDNRYWKFWPTVSWEAGNNLKPKINPDILKQMALDTDYPDTSLLEVVCNDLKQGANIGCDTEHREASNSTNAPCAHEDGEKVSDAICEWLEQGYAIGPLCKDDIPFEWIKVNGLMTRPSRTAK